MPLEMKSVYSSWVSEIGFDVDAQQLVVTTQKGVRLVYDGVPADVAERVLKAPSIGEALHAEVRGKYGHAKL